MRSEREIDWIVEQTRKPLEARIKVLEAERSAAIRETGNLRDGITKAIGMKWIEVPQPLGGVVRVCPDDSAIIAACAALTKDP